MCLEVHEKTIWRDPKSLYIFNNESCFRTNLIWLTEWKQFDRFITLIILANSVLLAIKDYDDRLLGPKYESEHNNVLE